MSTPFNSFDVSEYVHLFPELPPSEEIINNNKDVDDCVWARYVPDYIHKGFIDLEVKRIRQGAFIYIKGVLIWLPPQYYFFLQYGTVKSINGRYAEFRLKKLKEYYFKEQCRRNVNCLGSYIIKNRRDGTTTNEMMSILWEMMRGLHSAGQIGIQSRTNDDAYDPCYLTLKNHLNGLPKYIRDVFYSDLKNPTHIESQMRFETLGENGRNVFAKYYPSGNASMDGKEMILCILDEVNKWDENSLLQTFGTYKKFILEGVIRKGLFVMFSSPAETNGRCNDEAYELWKLSDTNDLQANGTTKSRIHRYHSNPLEGITGLFDKFGDADQNIVYEHIMSERKNAPKDLKLNEIRGFPLNEEEAFGSFDSSVLWDNNGGLIKRKLYVSRTKYKDEETLEPKVMWGNLEWENGIVDTTVVFRPNAENEFNINTGRFCFSELPKFDVPLVDIRKPPIYIDSCIGVDPFHLGKGTKHNKGSLAGVINFKFREFGNTEFAPHPNMMYNCRTLHIHTFFEDMIKASVYLRAKMQYEKSSDEIERYFDSRGYGEWVLNPSNGKKPQSSRPEISRGRGGGAFMTEILSLINILTNIPVNEGDPYPLEHFWFEELIDQIISLNRDNTTESDLFMGLGQAVIGAAKLSSVKIRTGTDLASSALSYILS